MSECCITFPGPVSRETVSQLVIDCLKYILYYRGQFPLPLDQLKQLLKKSSEFVHHPPRNLKVDGQQIFYDHNVIISRSSVAVNRTKQNFMDTILKFDEFFNELCRILETQNVMEIVLNLGSNMMNPKELYRITLPTHCSRPECTTNYASLQRCKLQFFREIMHSELWEDLKTDSLLPISVLLLLQNDIALNERMEQKSFYTFPRHCKQRKVRFIENCCHIENASIKLESFENISISNEISSSNEKAAGLWVKLKPDLKGFKSYKENNRSVSCSALK